MIGYEAACLDPPNRHSPGAEGRHRVIRPGKSWLRSRLIVDRGLQFNLVTRMVIFVLFVFCVICAVLFSPLVRRLTGGDDPESQALAEVLLYMQDRFWPAALLCLVVAVIGAALTSHRIAGPLGIEEERRVGVQIRSLVGLYPTAALLATDDPKAAVLAA